jgi:hypothetical protein
MDTSVITLFMDNVLQFVLTAAALGVIGSAICRVNILKPREHKYGWSLQYIAMALYAGILFVELAQHKRWPSEAEWVGLYIIVVNILMTHKQWLAGPPPIVHK